MSRIPEFETRQLASSAVGTPGVDKSQEMLWTSAANAAKGVEDSALALSKRRQEAQDQMAAVKTSLEQQRQMEKMTLAHNETYANSDVPIEEQQAEYDKKAKEIQTNLMGTLASPGARYRFELTGSEYAGNASVKQLKTASQNQALYALKGVKEEMDKNGYALAELAGSSVSLEDKLKSIEEKKALMTELTDKPFLSPESRVQLKLALPEQMARAYLSTAVLYNPAEALDVLKSGVFGDFDPLARKELENQALTAIPAFKKRAEVLSIMDHLGDLSQVFEKMKSRDQPGALQVLANMEPKQRKNLMEIIYSSELSRESAAGAESEIDDAILKLEIDKSTRTTDQDGVAITEVLDKMTTSVMNNIKTGNGVSVDFFKRRIEDVILPYISRVREQKPYKGEPISAHAQMMDSIGQYFAGYRDVETRSPEVISTYNRASEILKKQPEVNAETITSSITQALWENASKKHPELRFIGPALGFPDAVLNDVGHLIAVTPTGSTRKADASEKAEEFPVLYKTDPKTKKVTPTRPQTKEQLDYLVAQGWTKRS